MPLKHDMNDAEAKSQPHSAIESTWEIVEGHHTEEFPFLVVCHLPTGKKIGFPCLTLAEAEAKLNGIAKVMFGKQPLATA